MTLTSDDLSRGDLKVMKVKIACSGQSVARTIGLGAKRVRVFNMSTIGVKEIKMASACIMNAHVYQTVSICTLRTQ